MQAQARTLTYEVLAYEVQANIADTVVSMQSYERQYETQQGESQVATCGEETDSRHALSGKEALSSNRDLQFIIIKNTNGCHCDVWQCTLSLWLVPYSIDF